jgi:hypothetical protein
LKSGPACASLAARKESVVERHTFGWRQLFGSVNLRDFIDMVRGELGMIGSSLRQGAQALPRLPAGPLVFLGFWLLAILRSALLIFVVVVFGTAILLISAVRGASRALRGGSGSA